MLKTFNFSQSDDEEFKFLIKLLEVSLNYELLILF